MGGKPRSRVLRERLKQASLREERQAIALPASSEEAAIVHAQRDLEAWQKATECRTPAEAKKHRAFLYDALIAWQTWARDLVHEHGLFPATHCPGDQRAREFLARAIRTLSTRAQGAEATEAGLAALEGKVLELGQAGKDAYEAGHAEGQKVAFDTAIRIARRGGDSHLANMISEAAEGRWCGICAICIRPHTEVALAERFDGDRYYLACDDCWRGSLRGGRWRFDDAEKPSRAPGRSAGGVKRNS